MSYFDSRQRNGTLAFARSLVNDQQWFEELWNKKDKLLNKPVLFIWGMKDKVISLRNLDKFEKGFPNSKAIRLEKAGHFPQEEESEKVIAAISGF